MAKTILVGCKLPHGIVLEHPLDPRMTVTLAGKNKSKLVDAPYAITEVDGDFWAQWSAVNKEFPPMVSGAIFVAKNEADVVAVAAENAGRLTGFEPMKTDGKDTRALGVKTTDKD